MLTGEYLEHGSPSPHIKLSVERKVRVTASPVLSVSAMTGEASARLFNVCVLGVSFMLLFTGFHTLTSVQHSHTASGTPVLTLAVVYSVMAVFSWAAPSLLVRLGHSWSQTWSEARNVATPALL